MENRITLSQLKQAYLQAAKIVARHGDTYLPIFERVETEYQERKKQIDALNRAIMIAESNTGFEP